MCAVGKIRRELRERGGVEIAFHLALADRDAGSARTEDAAFLGLLVMGFGVSSWADSMVMSLAARVTPAEESI